MAQATAPFLDSTKFRKFSSFDEAFEEHARLLATSHFYVAAMRVKDDPNKFADALTGVYATDPSYGTKLRRIMADHSLYQYDHFAPSLPQTPGSLGPHSEQATPILVNMTAGGSAVASATLSLGSRGPQVTALQQALVKLGYHVGATDGIFGTLTRSALVAFQLDNNLDGSGVADVATWAAFDKAPSRPLDPGRTKATPADVGKLGSQTIRHADNTRMVGLISAILGALGIGNSTVVAATGGSSGGPQVPANLTEFVGGVQQLLANPALKGLNGVNHDELNKLVDMAKELQKTASSAVSPETLQILQQIRQLMPGELAQKYPDILKFLDVASTLHPTQGTVAHTVFDFLPGLFKAGGTPQIVSDGIAAVASSIIPGFGGSVAVLALGLAARYFGNQIIQARTRDHQDASNLAV